MTLESITPEEAVQDYLNGRTDLTQSSKENHKNCLRRFEEWCDENEVTEMKGVTGKQLHKFKVWRSGDINNVTLRNQLGTLRQFLQFCENIDVVASGVSEKLELPTLGLNEEVNDTMLTDEEAKQILEYLEKYEYATLRHVTFYLFWHTGIRTSTIQTIDVTDFHPEEEYPEVVHHPNSNTLLKNRKKGEREIQLQPEVSEVVHDWIHQNHPRAEDEHGRLPLIGTRHGRAHKTTIQAQIYRVTRPCHYLNECPHERSVDDCEATYSKNASKCPSSVSPHAIRKGSITYHRNNGWPSKAVSDRADVSEKILDKHYDKGTEEDKRKRRGKFLENIYVQSGSARRPGGLLVFDSLETC